MDRERLFRHLEQRYTSKRDMIARIPLGTQADAIWQELLNRRRSSSTVLPLSSRLGTPYWYVTTEKMVAASEKIVEALLENEQEFDPYTEAPAVATLDGELFAFPVAQVIPDRVNELTAFLADAKTHPLIKAAVAQAWAMVIRPFPEGNEACHGRIWRKIRPTGI